MEKCMVYKGLDSPCKIRGLISKYFYIVFAVALIELMLLGMSILTLLQTGNKIDFFMGFFIEGLILGVLYRFFYKRSNVPKLSNKPIIITITNRDLYKNLNKKKYG